MQQWYVPCRCQLACLHRCCLRRRHQRAGALPSADLPAAVQLRRAAHRPPGHSVHSAARDSSQAAGAAHRLGRQPAHRRWSGRSAAPRCGGATVAGEAGRLYWPWCLLVVTEPIAQAQQTCIQSDIDILVFSRVLQVLKGCSRLTDAAWQLIAQHHGSLECLAVESCGTAAAAAKAAARQHAPMTSAAAADALSCCRALLALTVRSCTAPWTATEVARLRNGCTALQSLCLDA